MTKSYLQQSEVNEDLNAIFLMRMKVGTESTSIFVAAPDRVIDPHHHRFTANIESINDKVYIEFYDVIDESAFDPTLTTTTDTANLKLLSIKCFDVKDFAFDHLGECDHHRVLLPIEYSGNVASFTLRARFHCEVPLSLARQLIEPQRDYLLFMRMIQTSKQAN